MILKLRTFHVFRSLLCSKAQEVIKFEGYIPPGALDISYCHSSGPGGQNVNARHTKVEIKFKIDDAIWIPSDLKEKIKEKHLNKVNNQGYLIIKSDKTRYQFINQADCFDKLRTLLWNLQNSTGHNISKDGEELYKERQEIRARSILYMKRERSLDKSFRKMEMVS